MCGLFVFRGRERIRGRSYDVVYHIDAPCPCERRSYEVFTIEVDVCQNLRSIRHDPMRSVLFLLGGNVVAKIAFARAFCGQFAQPRVVVVERDAVMEEFSGLEEPDGQ